MGVKKVILKVSWYVFYLVELGEVVHGNRAGMNVKHGCSLFHMQILKQTLQMGKLEQNLAVAFREINYSIVSAKGSAI